MLFWSPHPTGCLEFSEHIKAVSPSLWSALLPAEQEVLAFPQAGSLQKAWHTLFPSFQTASEHGETAPSISPGPGPVLPGRCGWVSGSMWVTVLWDHGEGHFLRAEKTAEHVYFMVSSKYINISCSNRGRGSPTKVCVSDCRPTHLCLYVWECVWLCVHVSLCVCVADREHLHWCSTIPDRRLISSFKVPLQGKDVINTLERLSVISLISCRMIRKC